MKDIIVLGAGLAGMACVYTVLKTFPKVQITLIHTADASSWSASSGISALNINRDDCIHQFTKDLVVHGSTQGKRLDIMVQESPQAIDWLQKWLEFSDQQVQLGGHSKARTFRPKESAIGPQLKMPLWEWVQAQQRVDIVDAQITRVKLQSSLYTLQDREGHMFQTRKLVMCTGGYAADAQWLQTLQVPGNTKYTTHTVGHNGILLRQLIAQGVPTIDLQEIQFHPTGFVDPQNPQDHKKFLAPEILRSPQIGGVLLNAEGKRFVDETRSRKQVYQAMCEQKQDQFVLRVDPHKVQEVLGASTWQFYRNKGFFSDQGEAQVTPVAHYCCGGIVTDEYGRVPGFPGLSAAGEITGGIHGSNRLAGCSLLDCVVFGRRAGLLK